MHWVYKIIFFTYVCGMTSSAVRRGLSRPFEFLQIIEQHGYTGEYHWVTTDDGYILRIDRITSSPLASANQDKPVVFIQHGIVCLSDLFVFWHPTSSLAFLLADAGYDVWFGNSRGTTNSRNHTTLSPDDHQYWNYDINDLGVKDLPTMIDYVLDVTEKEQLSYIGHSMGTTMSFVLLSAQPEYNDKFNLLTQLAPIAFWNMKDIALLKPLFVTVIQALRFALRAPDYAAEVFYSDGFVTTFCDLHIIADDICAAVLNILIGHPSRPFTDSEADYVTDYIPAGTSLKILEHFLQNINVGRLTQFDYKNWMINRQVYGQTKPPAYDLSKITAPVALFSAHGDMLATKHSVKQLVPVLQNLVINFVVEDPKFTHLDFIFYKDIQGAYADRVLQLINQYNS